MIGRWRMNLINAMLFVTLYGKFFLIKINYIVNQILIERK